jgi:hypothetical protein
MCEFDNLKMKEITNIHNTQTLCRPTTFVLRGLMRFRHIQSQIATKDYSFNIIRHQYKVEYRYGIFVGGNSEPESITEN